ncbi:MAG: hypothetical protein IJB44_07635 [Clostridia bacterium]|nr:hypothetical protein [Clostridia bacterium]
MLTVDNKKICELCFSEFPLFSDTCFQCDGKCLNDQKGQSELAKGTILAGRYLVGKNINNSNIYFCYDLKTNRRLIVKEYYPRIIADRVEGENTVVYRDPGGVPIPNNGIDVFVNDAKTFYNIGRSPYFLNIYDLFYENNTAYCIMEYFNFNHVRPYYPENEALYIMKFIMNAFEYLHNHRIVYKYFDSGSILVDKESAGNIKLWCFPETSHTLGALHVWYYDLMLDFGGPPELLNPDGHIGPWTDIFSLGEVIYEMIAGRTPVDAPYRLDRNEDIDPTGISTEFYLILNKMLKPKHQDRYQNINELRRDINLLKLKPKFPLFS